MPPNQITNIRVRREENSYTRRTAQLLKEIAETDVIYMFEVIIVRSGTRLINTRNGVLREQYADTFIDRFYSKDRNLLFNYFRETLARYKGNDAKVNWLEAFSEIDENIKEYVDNRILNTKKGPDTNNTEKINGYIQR
jgi:uncharacterized protein YdcH (DUF465 family)